MCLYNIPNIKTFLGKLPSIRPHGPTQNRIIYKSLKSYSQSISIFNWNYKSIFTINYSIFTPD